jgi:hypothetical protein
MVRRRNPVVLLLLVTSPDSGIRRGDLLAAVEEQGPVVAKEGDSLLSPSRPKTFLLQLGERNSSMTTGLPLGRERLLLPRMIDIWCVTHPAFHEFTFYLGPWRSPISPAGH